VRPRDNNDQLVTTCSEISKVDRLCVWLSHKKQMSIWKDTYNVRFEVFTAVTMKNGVFWDVTPCGSCGSEEPSASFIRVTRIGELGTALGISSQRASVASYS
jgi:hypothetical protein